MKPKKSKKSLQKILSKINTKRLHTTTTHFIYISNIINTKY